VENAALVGLSRQVALRRELEVVANNLANLGTAGFKNSQLVFNEFLMPVASADTFPRGQDRRLSYVEDKSTWQDFASGPVQTTGNNLDVAIDCIGIARSVNNMVRITKDHLVIFGVPHGDIQFTMQAWFKDMTIQACGPRLARGADYARHLLQSGQVNVDHFINAVLPLERYDEGVQQLIDKKAIKVACDPRLTA